MNTAVFGSREPSDSGVLGEATPQLAPGSTIQGKYVIHGVLGLGGFAVVYDAEHMGLGRRLAIKVMHLSSDTPLALLERFRREARISALVSHSNVLEVYDTGTLPDGSPYLVMERLNGANLSCLLRSGPMSLAAAVEVGRQLLNALVALADADVVHRDIKPDNLMLHETADGELVLKLVDFGIAKRVAIEAQAKLTCHGTLVGTPQYMSPEQIRGQEIDARTDLYATGAVLYEALSGRAPHESQTFSELVVAVLNAPLRPLRTLRANCPPELERIVTKALSRVPSQRYDCARAMLDELEACARELDLPSGAAALVSEDPIDPIWMTPARISFPILRGWWLRDTRRPLQLAVGMLMLAVPSVAVHHYRTSDTELTSIAGSLLQGVGNPAPIAQGREPPSGWDTPGAHVSAPVVSMRGASAAQAERPSSEGPSSQATEQPSSGATERPSSEAAERPSSEATERPSSESAERPLSEPGERRPSDARAAVAEAPASVHVSAAKAPAPAERVPRVRAAERMREGERAEGRAVARSLGADRDGTRPPPVPASEGADKSAELQRDMSDEGASVAGDAQSESSRTQRWEGAMDAALANMIRGELHAAKLHYEEATRVAPNKANAFRGLGLVCARLGHEDDARRALARYLALAPQASDAAMIQQRLGALEL